MAFSPDKLPSAGMAARFLGKRKLSKGGHNDSSQLAKLVKELKTNSSLRFLGLGSPAHISGKYYHMSSGEMLCGITDY